MTQSSIDTRWLSDYTFDPLAQKIAESQEIMRGALQDYLATSSLEGQHMAYV